MKIVVVDIDGTLSKVSEERLKHLQTSPKNWDAFYAECFDDKPIPEIVDMVKMLSHHYQIIFCTGRRESVRVKTIEWLRKHVDEYQFRTQGYTVLMRGDWDKRPDVITKQELLFNWLWDNGHNIHWRDGVCLDVAFIIEDRASMVKLWREVGYTCLQVAEGDF